MAFFQRFFKTNQPPADEVEFTKLTEQSLPTVYRFVFSIVKNQADAEDITQEAFVRAWRHFKKFDQTRSFKTWLFAIAKNVAFDWLKKKSTIPFSQFDNDKGDNHLLDTLTDPEPLPNELLERADAAKILTEALNKLSPEKRLVVLLYHYYNHTFKEMAEIINEPLNTVKSRYRRALQSLRDILAK